MTPSSLLPLALAMTSGDLLTMGIIRTWWPWPVRAASVAIAVLSGYASCRVQHGNIRALASAYATLAAHYVWRDEAKNDIIARLYVALKKEHNGSVD